MKVHTKVQELTGYERCLFRPPYGDCDNHIITNAHACGYYPIQWSIDSLDWKDYGADDIVKRVVESDKLNNGAIILMHNGAKYTADAQESVITGLQEKGYEIVSVSQLIYKEYHMKSDGTQVSGQEKNMADIRKNCIVKMQFFYILTTRYFCSGKGC